MFNKITLFALLGALSVSANQVSNLLARSEHSPFLARQITAAQIPTACQSQCTSAISIYQSCTTGDNAGCLAVCQASNYSGFVGCLQCVLSNTPGVSSSETAALNAVLGQLATACSAAGQTVAATTLVAGAATGSASASASGATMSMGPQVSGENASISSMVSSVTGSASRMSSASSSGAVASVSNAINSVSSVAGAAASSSRAAGDSVAKLPQGLETMVFGLVGLVAGAAYIL